MKTSSGSSRKKYKVSTYSWFAKMYIANIYSVDWVVPFYESVCRCQAAYYYYYCYCSPCFFSFVFKLMVQFDDQNLCRTTFFAIFIFISQMGFGSQGHKSWKTDGPRRHQGHCGHNESAYVCSFTVPSTTPPPPPLFIPYPPDYWSHHLHLPVDRYMGSVIQGINHKAGPEHTTEC